MLIHLTRAQSGLLATSRPQVMKEYVVQSNTSNRTRSLSVQRNTHLSYKAAPVPGHPQHRICSLQVLMEDHSWAALPQACDAHELELADCQAALRAAAHAAGRLALMAQPTVVYQQGAHRVSAESRELPASLLGTPLAAPLDLLVGPGGVGVALQVLPEHLCVGPGDVHGEIELGHAPGQRLARDHDAVGQLGRAHKVLLPGDLVRGIDGPLPEQAQDDLQAGRRDSAQTIPSDVTLQNQKWTRSAHLAMVRQVFSSTGFP